MINLAVGFGKTMAGKHGVFLKNVTFRRCKKVGRALHGMILDGRLGSLRGTRQVQRL